MIPARALGRGAARAVAEPAVAVIVAVPPPVALTSPALLTVTTASSLEVQVIDGEANAAPPWSVTVAVSCSVWPTVVSVTVPALGATSAGTFGSEPPPHRAAEDHAGQQARQPSRRLERMDVLGANWCDGASKLIYGVGECAVGTYSLAPPYRR